MKNNELNDFYEMIESRGYHSFEPPNFGKYENVKKAYQKRFDDEKGKRYFIDIYIYEELIHPLTGESYGHAVEYETQLNDINTDYPVNIQFFAGWSVDLVEERLKEIFETGRYRYYETWDEC